jgi:hypothetical protein
MNSKNKIDQFFSPQAEGKRKRNKQSPGDKETAKKPLKEVSEMEVKSMTADQMADLISRTVEAKLQLFASRAELVALQQKVESGLAHQAKDIKELKEENRLLKEKIKELSANRETQDRNIDDVRNEAKSLNLIFKGINSDDSSNPALNVERLCKEILGLGSLNITEAYFVGNPKLTARPILAKFASTKDKIAILKNAKKLKGTMYSIAQDLAFNTRRNRGKMLAIRKEIRKFDKGIEVKIVKDWLIMKDGKFSWSSQQGLMWNNTPGLDKLKLIMKKDMSEFIGGLEKGGGKKGGDLPPSSTSSTS